MHTSTSCRFWRSLSLGTILGLAGLPAPARGQPPGDVWDGPYSFFAEQTKYEIAHAALLGRPGPQQGKVVFWRINVGTDGGPWIWDPAAPSAIAPAHAGLPPAHNIFCAGHTQDKDGDLILGGGEKDTCDGVEPNWAHVHRPNQDTWIQTGDMLAEVPAPTIYGHYYPSLVTMFNGIPMSLGGGTSPTTCSGPPAPVIPSNEFQWFDKAGNVWRGRPTGAAFPGLPTVQGTVSVFGFKYYPIFHLLRSGYLFASVVPFGAYDSSNIGGNVQNRNYSISALVAATTWPPTVTAWNWQLQQYGNRMTKSVQGQEKTVNLFFPTAGLRPATVHADGSISEDDEVVIFGGLDAQGNALPAAAESIVWTIKKPTPTSGKWLRSGQSGGLPAMNYARVYANAVFLPDLSAIVFGGALKEFGPYRTLINGEKAAEPVYQPERLDFLAATPIWQLQPPHQSPRLYHSIALLLPDGRVLVLGGYKSTVNNNPKLQHSDAEVFTPPYLQQGLPRPVITGAPATVGYGQSMIVNVSIPDDPAPGLDIDFATLVRCASVTHHFDWDQRCTRLEVAQRDGDSVTLAALPAKGGTTRGDYLLPPGYYMLFVLRKPAGSPQVRVPSVAHFVQVQ